MVCDFAISVNPDQCPVAAVVLPFPNGFSAALPTPPALPVYDYETLILCKKSNGEPVIVTTTKLATDPPSLPPTVSFWDVVAETAYAGAASTLQDCGKEKFDFAGEQIYCAGGLEYTSRDVFDVSVTPPALQSTIWKNSTGAVVSAPANPVLGKCVISNAVTITGTALAQIAGASLVGSNPNFAGQPDVIDTSAIGGNLVSVTISAKGVTDGQSSPNRVEVDLPDGTIAYLFNGETKEFNLSRGQETSLRRDYKIRATGNAYANIHGSFE